MCIIIDVLSGEQGFLQTSWDKYALSDIKLLERIKRTGLKKKI